MAKVGIQSCRNALDGVMLGDASKSGTVSEAVRSRSHVCIVNMVKTEEKIDFACLCLLLTCTVYRAEQENE